MSKMIGIDISKDSFDAAWTDEKSGKLVHRKLSNDKKGWQLLQKTLAVGDRLVMEASGVYYLRLAVFFQKQGFAVSVVNPLVIRRFSQMANPRVKTDKKDAQTIAQYAVRMADKLADWEFAETHLLQMNQIEATLELLTKQRTAVTNQLHALEHQPFVTKEVKKALEKIVQTIDDEAKKLEKQLDDVAKIHFSDQMKALKSIPGIGQKTARKLVAATHGFQRFENAKQLAAFIGICPSPYQSGSSVKGKGHISKHGSPSLRKALYICTWQAIAKNPFCKQLRDRMIQNGKPPKVALIAVAHKLLRQAFGVAKSLIHFDHNFSLNPAF